MLVVAAGGVGALGLALLAHLLPEDLVAGRRDLRNLGVAAAHLVLNVAGRLGGLGLLQAAGLGAVPHDNLAAHVEDEAVALVHRGGVHGHLLDANLAAALDVQQARLKGVAVHVLKARGHASGLVKEAGGEERDKLVRLVLLHLAVLHGLAAQALVELDRLVGGHALLVLRRVLAEPEEDVALQGVGALLWAVVGRGGRR